MGYIDHAAHKVFLECKGRGFKCLALQPVYNAEYSFLFYEDASYFCQDVKINSSAWSYLVGLYGCPEKLSNSSREICCLRMMLFSESEHFFNSKFDDCILISNREEIQEVSSLLLNSNGLHFLNNADHARYAEYWPDREAKISNFFFWNGLSPSRVIIDSSLVLELYGIRRARDIDYLAMDDVRKTDPLFGDNECSLVYHGVEKFDLINDAQYNFTLNGVKFVSFDQLMKCKRQKGRLKDYNDLMMMLALQKRRFWCIAVGRLIFKAIITLESLCGLFRSSVSAPGD
ncbi:hypothetical protein [Halomonas sp. LBP4]|uniref:hypothetical protein n=1 Tax=Halomonas sp. LBP4 TaxID=2044917 RepID=UPI0011B72E0C|nr:hypothetical protein [Halomonas sp. LBP4]